MNSSRFLPSDRLRQDAIERISNFCRDADRHSGGILLVAGERGAGKTRLVDEALNTPRATSDTDPGKHSGRLDWIRTNWNRLFDGKSGSRRKHVNRTAHNCQRTLIPVNVSPFFPHHSTVSNDSSQEQAIRLIQNIVFALTSGVDPRSSQRRHGRTLRTRLGWFNYWFNLRALFWSGPNWLLPWLCMVLLPLSFFVGCVIGRVVASPILDGILAVLSLGPIGFALPIDGPWQAFEYTILGTIFTTPLAWLLLRQLDLGALSRMSRRLYDLVNAQTMKQEELKRMDQRTRPSDWAPAIIATTTLIGGIVISAGGFLPGRIDMRQAIALLGVFGLSSIFISRPRTLATEFGPENHAWMITLLRRHLFLAHRCGLEPILVIDELDKLAAPPYTKPLAHPPADECPTPSPTAGDTEDLVDTPGECDDSTNTNNTPTCAPLPPADRPLTQFIDALLTLKHSLGADFLWILIDNFYLLSELRKERKGYTRRQSEHLGIPGLGPLATLIQQEVVLSPISFKGYIKLESNYPHTNTSTGPVLGLLEQLANHAYAWLHARGIMAYLCPGNQGWNQLQPNPTSREQALLLAFSCQWLSDKSFRNANMYLMGGGDTEDPMFAANSQILAPTWARAWILSGMLELGDKLLRPQFNRVTYATYEGEDSPTHPRLEHLLEQLENYSPADFRLLGQHLLFRLLRRLHDYGRELPHPYQRGTTITLEAGHFGIPPRGPLLNDIVSLKVEEGALISKLHKT